MTGLHLRAAGVLDARAAAAFLSDVLSSADTSAISGPVDTETMARWMRLAPDRAAWTIAEDDGGEIRGLQWIEPNADLRADTADIATFVDPGRQQLGIGSALFEATVRQARDLGFRVLHASVRADNTGGLIYYKSRGFELWRRIPDVPLADGRTVDRLRLLRDLCGAV